ncbi:EIN3-binding F-box protein 1 [Citrus sinensis]|nr:EIN3-binding F-box protein 1 [Citrus sinensis]
MHSCLADLNDVVLAPIFVCALFFALFGGFLGQDLFRFNFPGFFELYSCQSSSLYLGATKIDRLIGSDDFCPGGPIYPNPKESGLLLPLGPNVDVYFRARKRSRISAPFVYSEERFEQKQVSIEVLPDECLFEIFRRLDGGEERSACASVSKRWLSLLSNIHRDEIRSLKPESEKKVELVSDAEDPDVERDGYLSRSLEGKKATDIRLAAIAVGTASRGGLGKLSIHGNNSTRGVTSAGLRAIARGCPSLRVLSLWNTSSVGDEGLCEIANGCHQLEKLDLCQCPAITDRALITIAKNCPKLIDLTIESCSSIGNEGLQAVGRFCPNLKSISIKDCRLVGDQGIASLLSSATYSLEKVKLQRLNITDVSLAVIGHYGMAVTDLFLTGLPHVSERGFWVMGSGHGLQKLKSLTITSCMGVTDLGLEAVGKGCPNLKQFCLRKCAFLSDNGLISFAKAAFSLESLQLEECHRITQLGFFGSLLNCGEKLKALSLVSCLGIKDQNLGVRSVSPCKSLRSLSIRNCPGFGDASLAVLGKLCPQLQNVDLSGLQGVTDAGFLPVLESCEAGLAKVNLSGCVNLTDKVVSTMAELHGWTLEMLNLDGCRKISDASLMAIADNCPLLCDLDVSKCAVTDFGIASLAHGNYLNLQILSLSGCSMVSDKSLGALRKLGQTLLGLNLQHCNAISTNSVDMLVEQLWRYDHMGLRLVLGLVEVRTMINTVAPQEMAMQIENSHSKCQQRHVSSLSLATTHRLALANNSIYITSQMFISLYPLTSPQNFIVSLMAVVKVAVILVSLLTSLTSKPVYGVTGREKLVGSRPPGCVNKCLSCKPCTATLVIQHRHHHEQWTSSSRHDRDEEGLGEGDGYYLQSWKCKCGNKLYQP